MDNAVAISNIVQTFFLVIFLDTVYYWMSVTGWNDRMYKIVRNKFVKDLLISKMQGHN